MTETVFLEFNTGIILINKVGGVVEYLGEDYPFYFKDYNEAARKLQDHNLIEITSNYLKNNKKINDQIKFDTFYDGLIKIF